MWVYFFEICNERQIWNLKAWFSASFSLKEKVEIIIVDEEVLLPKLTIWNSLTNNFTQHGIHGEFFKHFNGMKLLGQLCLKNFISLLSGCINQYVLQNVKNMHSYVFTCDFQTGLICVACWITVSHPLHWRYIAAKNGETFAIIVASRVTIGVSIRTFTVAQKYNNGMSVFIISFSLVIKQPSMSLIEVLLLQNHFLRKDNMVKLQDLCSSAFELNIDKDSKLCGYATKGNFNLVNNIVDPLLQILEIEKDYIISGTLAHATTVFSDFLVWYGLLERSIEHANDVHKFHLSFSSLGYKSLATFLMVTWNISGCCSEELFHLVNVKIMVLNSSVKIIPWDPGKLNAFMAKVACECYWRNFLSIYCLLNWVFGRRNHFQPLPTGLNEESQLEAEPEEALDTRRNDQGEVEVLVKWEGLPEFENSWELASKMRKEFPRFLLEVKENFEGGGIDSYDIFYKRKRGQKDTANHSLIGMFPYSAREEKIDVDQID
ncbi:unnamed protein product [Trifolium pratense]|uniref:Uncharacterized protein n=1 Tax=Trifolium pratense TaxID=57577 RepID=A0ACB0MD04_TRIPR|nr:unnamed protein product [Trifolium pratense]